MELQSTKPTRIKSEIKPESPQPFDLNKIVEDSKRNLINEKPKRVRRTRAEIEAASKQPEARQNLSALSSQTSFPQANVDRTKELKPAFLLYSDLFLAKPLDCEDLKFSDQEAEAMASVTSNLMNAFPEYFNSADPKITAILGAVIVAAPIGYTKYKIFKAHEKKAKTPVAKEKTSVINNALLA